MFEHEDPNISPELLDDFKAKNFIKLEGLTCLIVTWNVNAKFDSNLDLSQLFDFDIGGTFPQLVVVGLQEIVELSASQVVGGTMTGSTSERVNSWKVLILNHLNSLSQRNPLNFSQSTSQYCCIDTVSMIGLWLGIYSLTTHEPFIRKRQTATLARGVGGMLGNKGAVYFRCEIQDSSLCFINAHFSAHRDKLHKRNADYHSILSSRVFPSPLFSPSSQSSSSSSSSSTSSSSSSYLSSVSSSSSSSFDSYLSDPRYLIQKQTQKELRSRIESFVNTHTPPPPPPPTRPLSSPSRPLSTRSSPLPPPIRPRSLPRPLSTSSSSSPSPSSSLSSSTSSSSSSPTSSSSSSSSTEANDQDEVSKDIDKDIEEELIKEEELLINIDRQREEDDDYDDSHVLKEIEGEEAVEEEREEVEVVGEEEEVHSHSDSDDDFEDDDDDDEDDLFGSLRVYSSPFAAIQASLKKQKQRRRGGGGKGNNQLLDSIGEGEEEEEEEREYNEEEEDDENENENLRENNEITQEGKVEWEGKYEEKEGEEEEEVVHTELIQEETIKQQFEVLQEVEREFKRMGIEESNNEPVTEENTIIEENAYQKENMNDESEEKLEGEREEEDLSRGDRETLEGDMMIEDSDWKINNNIHVLPSNSSSLLFSTSTLLSSTLSSSTSSLSPPSFDTLPLSTPTSYLPSSSSPSLSPSLSLPPPMIDRYNHHNCYLFPTPPPTLSIKQPPNHQHQHPHPHPHQNYHHPQPSSRPNSLQLQPQPQQQPPQQQLLSTRFPPSISEELSSFSADDHDIVLWLGDLNYRLEEKLPLSLINEWIINGELDELKKYDQLSLEKEKGYIFQGFSEGEIQFPPTYKFIPGTDEYEGLRGDGSRCPSWCDRVLWRVGGRGAMYNMYTSPHFHQHYSTSSLSDSSSSTNSTSRQVLSNHEIEWTNEKEEKEIKHSMTSNSPSSPSLVRSSFPPYYRYSHLSLGLLPSQLDDTLERVEVLQYSIPAAPSVSNDLVHDHFANDRSSSSSSSQPSPQTSPLSSSSSLSYCMSDHKPVRAVLNIRVKRVDWALREMALFELSPLPPSSLQTSY